MNNNDFSTVLCGECRDYRAGKRDKVTMRQYGRCRVSGEVVERCMDCENGQARLRGRPRPTPLQIALSRAGRNWFHKRMVPHNDYLRGVSR